MVILSHIRQKSLLKRKRGNEMTMGKSGQNQLAFVSNKSLQRFDFEKVRLEMRKIIIFSQNMLLNLHLYFTTTLNKNFCVCEISR